MTMWDLAFDPLTDDLIRDDAGGWARTETGDTAVLNQLRVHFGECWSDDGIGSLLHDRARFAAAPGPAIAAEARRAMGLLVDAQYLDEVSVQAQETRAGHVDGRTSYRLVETGQLVEMALPRLRG